MLFLSVYFWKLKWELVGWGEAKWQSKFLYIMLKADFPRLAEKRNKCFLDPGGSAFSQPEWFIFNSDSSLELLNRKSNDSFIILLGSECSELCQCPAGEPGVLQEGGAGSPGSRASPPPGAPQPGHSRGAGAAPRASVTLPDICIKWHGI